MVSDLKQALLGGTQHLEVVPLVRPDKTTVDAKVRPLNALEASEVEAISKIGLKGPANEQGKIEVMVDIAQFQGQQMKASVRAVRYGLSHSGESWTDEEVQKLLPGWVEQLAGVVYVVSGLKLPRVGSFRVSGGDGKGTSDAAGGAAGARGDGGAGDGGAGAVGGAGREKSG